MTVPAQPPKPRRVVLALGSNLGDRLENLQGAVDALFDAAGLDFRAVSPVYETLPVGGPEQPDYLNAVITVDTALSVGRSSIAHTGSRRHSSAYARWSGGRAPSTWT